LKDCARLLVGRPHTVAGAGADIGFPAQHCSPCILDRENGTYLDSLREVIAATGENGGSWSNTATFAHLVPLSVAISPQNF
jgi:hypothetical protein